MKKTFALFVGVVGSLSLIALSPLYAQGFYGGNEYMDRPVTAPPPNMREFTHLLPPPPPPSSPVNAWQRDGYRRGDVNSAWSAPQYGYYAAPQTTTNFEGWNEPNFVPYGGVVQSTNGYNSTGTATKSQACVDGICVGGVN